MEDITVTVVQRQGKEISMRVVKADAVLYLTDAATVTGHILYVDSGAHFGHW